MKRVINPLTGAAIKNFSLNHNELFPDNDFLPGEDIVVEDAVAKHLQEVYGFLEVEDIKKTVETNEKVKKPRIKTVENEKKGKKKGK